MDASARKQARSPSIHLMSSFLPEVGELLKLAEAEWCSARLPRVAPKALFSKVGPGKEKAKAPKLCVHSSTLGVWSSLRGLESKSWRLINYMLLFLFGTLLGLARVALFDTDPKAEGTHRVLLHLGGSSCKRDAGHKSLE